MTPLLTALTELHQSLGAYSIDDERRMRAIVHELSRTIRSWAPLEDRSLVAFHTIHEIADRLDTEIG